MLAMILEKLHQRLVLKEVPTPVPNDDQVLIKIQACGICRTDLHVVDGELTDPKLPLIPGHQIVGDIVQLGKNVHSFSIHQRVGVSWLGHSCGTCDYCLSESENLCDFAKYTGYQINGGFAEYCVAYADYCFPIPKDYSNVQAAPLLCAGLIGYRAYRKVEKAKHLGIYGFGAAGHILIQVARARNQSVYVFTTPGDHGTQDFALKLGATWAGDSILLPPVALEGAIIFAPVGALVPQALKSIRKGGIVVCAGIHMSDIPSFPYSILWGERTICSIANLTRQDGENFLKLAPMIPIHTNVQVFSLKETNEALDALRSGQIKGAAVIKI